MTSWNKEAQCMGKTYTKASEYGTTRGVIQNDPAYQILGVDAPRRYVTYNEDPKRPEPPKPKYRNPYATYAAMRKFGIKGQCC